MHKLLADQLRNATCADGAIDIDALTAAVVRTYEEFDRERRLNDRAAKLMEEELRAANDQVKRRGERLLAEALEGAPSAIVLVSPTLTIECLNPAMLVLAGASEAPPPNTRIVDFLASAMPPEELRVMIDRLFAGENPEFETAGRWHMGAARRLTDGGYAVVFSNVTALKEREAALATAKEAAESANRLKSQFLAVMSHELRTPLNAILGFSEIIRDTTFGRGDEQWERYCDYARLVHDSGEHLLMLISDVLDLSKLEASSYSLYIERIDLAEIVKSSLDIVRNQARRANVHLAEFEPTCDLHLEGDFRALKQITLNLLSNAVKFTPPGGEVSVSVDASADRIVLCVQDTGIGIAREHLAQVFDAFHQGDARLSRRYEGTGLGLSICRGLAEMHGGTVSLESELGSGTKVTVSLPRAHNARRTAVAA